MDDDLNTPLGFAALFDFVRESNSLLDAGKIGKKDAKLALDFLKKLDTVFAVMDFEQNNEISKENLALIKEREKFRAEKKWTESDKIRDQLAEKGIELKDTATGTKWKLIK